MKNVSVRRLVSGGNDQPTAIFQKKGRAMDQAAIEKSFRFRDTR